MPFEEYNLNANGIFFAERAFFPLKNQFTIIGFHRLFAMLCVGAFLLPLNTHKFSPPSISMTDGEESFRVLLIPGTF